MVIDQVKVIPQELLDKQTLYLVAELGSIYLADRISVHLDFNHYIIPPTVQVTWQVVTKPERI